MSISRSSMGPYPAPTDAQRLAAEMSRWSKVYHPIKEKQTMSDFQYTDKQQNLDSSAVRHAYYNSHDKALVVVLRSNGNAYRYDGVPSWVWSTFAGAHSKGHVFAVIIKPSYGPSKFLGVASRLKFDEYGVPAPSMARIPLSSDTDGQDLRRRRRRRPPVRDETVGTPKALVDNSATSSSVPVLETAGVRKARTSVLIEGATGKRHTVNFADKSTVDEALAEIDELFQKLGVDVKVMAVTVHFE